MEKVAKKKSRTGNKLKTTEKRAKKIATKGQQNCIPSRRSIVQLVLEINSFETQKDLTKRYQERGKKKILHIYVYVYII